MAADRRSLPSRACLLACSALLALSLPGLASTTPPHLSQPKPSATHPMPVQQALPMHGAAASQAQRQPTPAFSQTHNASMPTAIPTVPRNYSNQPAPAYRPNYNERAMLGQQGRPFPGQQPMRPQQSNPNGGGEHLGSWMHQHQNQSPQEQERALRQEPGFNRLAPQQQQNLVNRLHQLNQMPPQQRARTLDRIENMERLSPERRQAVRSSAQQLGELPPDRKRMVQKAFRDLRDMPPEQRQAVMNSPQFAGQFSAQERSIMGNLLTVEPYQHPGPNTAQQQYGK